jgi:hypothetical protein
MPGGYTTSAPVQAPVQTPPPGFGTPPPIQPPIDFPPIDPPINIGGPVEPPVNIGGPVPDPIQVPPPVFIDPPIGGPVGGPIPDPIFPPMPPINVGGPVGGPVPDPVMPPIDPPFGVPGGNPFEYDPPINIGGPVGMSPQETAKMSSQQELLNLMSNKDILKEIPADDGVRNQYQVELDEYINKSPINMDTYKEELPVGSAINLGIPAVMETVVPMAVPGLGLAKNISNSLQSNNNSSSVSRPSTPSVSRPSVSRPNYSHSQVSKFGR